MCELAVVMNTRVWDGGIVISKSDAAMLHTCERMLPSWPMPHTCAWLSGLLQMQGRHLMAPIMTPMGGGCVSAWAWAPCASPAVNPTLCLGADGCRLCERLGLGPPMPPPPPPPTTPPPPASPAPAGAWPLSPRSAPVTPRSPWPPRSPQAAPQGGTATWRALRKRLQVPNGAVGGSGMLPGGRPMAVAPQPSQWSPR